MGTRSRVIIFLILIISLATLLPAAGANAEEDLVYHTIKTDQHGNIIPWYSPNLGEAYDHNIRLVWNFWKNMRDCPNGVKYYLQHQVWTKKVDDPRGLGGDQLNMALSSWNLLHQYIGDVSVKEDMIHIADYYIENSFSKPTDVWPNLPYPYNTDLHSGIYDGDMRAGKGFLQPDKAASFGAELITLFKITGTRKYLDVAIGIANTLADKMTTGDADNSPWPFRVNAQTGEVHRVKKGGKVHTASYTAGWAPALRLYQDLVTLDEGRVADYQEASRKLIAWLKAHPITTNRWGPYFEDIATHRDTHTEVNADSLAMVILEHPEWGDDWREHVRSILNWSSGTLGNDEWLEFGVVPINEQTVYRVPGNSHTSRHASVELRLAEKTGDHSRKEHAIRQLNWATYMVNEDGKNRYPENDIWLTDGYGDYIRHYLRAMASAPELAPHNQNHLLRTTSVVQNITYGSDAIVYAKFDQFSTERLKLGEWEPGSCEGGQMRWDPATRVLEIIATSNVIRILKRP